MSTSRCEMPWYKLIARMSEDFTIYLIRHTLAVNNGVIFRHHTFLYLCTLF